MEHWPTFGKPCLYWTGPRTYRTSSVKRQADHLRRWTSHYAYFGATWYIGPGPTWKGFNP